MPTETPTLCARCAEPRGECELADCAEHTIPGLCVACCKLLAITRCDVHLSSGRCIRHYRAANGSQIAYATPGDISMTLAECAEYEAQIKGGRS